MHSTGQNEKKSWKNVGAHFMRGLVHLDEKKVVSAICNFECWHVSRACKNGWKRKRKKRKRDKHPYKNNYSKEIDDKQDENNTASVSEIETDLWYVN